MMYGSSSPARWLFFFSGEGTMSWSLLFLLPLLLFLPCLCKKIIRPRTGRSSVSSQGCPRILRWKRKDGSFSDVIRERKRKSVRRCGQEVNEKSAALRLKYLIALFSESLGEKFRTEKSNMFIRMVIELQSCFSDEHSRSEPL